MPEVRAIFRLQRTEGACRRACYRCAHRGTANGAVGVRPPPPHGRSSFLASPRQQRDQQREHEPRFWSV